MRKIVLLLLLSIIMFSCQKTETKKKSGPIASENKVDKQDKDSVSKDAIIKLPKDRYAVVTLESYVDKDEDHSNIELDRPISVRIFDSKTKKEVPETLLEGIYYSEARNEDDWAGGIWYGDFNFDGKMDIACQGRDIGYRDFYSRNFFLATQKGYQLNKDFLEITDSPIAYIKLDAKKKTITAYREAEYNASFEYKIKNNKLELGRSTQDADRHGPFYYHYDSEAAIPERTILSYNDDFFVMSFKTEDKKKNILLFLYDEYETNNFNLHYAEMINDSLVDSNYSGDFIYNQKKGTLIFTDTKFISETASRIIKYKVFENETDFGIEITEKGKTIKLIGDPDTKKGSLSSIISLKRDEKEKNDREFDNVVIEK